MSPKDLSFKAGDSILVVKVREKDWWLGQLNGLKGYFPINYMKNCTQLEKL